MHFDLNSGNQIVCWWILCVFIVDQTALEEENLDRFGWGCQHAAILSGKDPKVVCDYVRSELPGNILFYHHRKYLVHGYFLGVLKHTTA